MFRTKLFTPTATQKHEKKTFLRSFGGFYVKWRGRASGRHRRVETVPTPVPGALWDVGWDSSRFFHRCWCLIWEEGAVTTDWWHFATCCLQRCCFYSWCPVCWCVLEVGCDMCVAIIIDWCICLQCLSSALMRKIKVFCETVLDRKPKLHLSICHKSMKQ